jgi:O-antigen ligase
MMVILLATPVIKPSIEYYIPIFRTIDVTVFNFVLTGLVGLYLCLRKAGKGKFVAPWPLLFPMVVIALLLFLGWTWSTAPRYGLRKAVRFAGICIPFVFIPSFFVRSKKDGHNLLRMVVFVGVLASLAMIFMPTSDLSRFRYGSGYGRGTFLGSDPNFPGLLVSLGMVIFAIILSVRSSASKFLKFAAFIIFPLGLLAIIKTGSRGAMAGLFAAVFLLPFILGKGNRKVAFLIPVITVAIFFILVIYIIASDSLAGESARWSKFVGLEEGASDSLISSRIHHYAFCLNNWMHRPLFGHGSGSFAMDFYDVDVPLWPHNIVLEAMYETGLFGTLALLSLFAIIANVAYKGMKQATTPEDTLLIGGSILLVVIMGSNALMHSDLEGSRYFYLFMGLLYVNFKLMEYENTQLYLEYYFENEEEAYQQMQQSQTPAVY